MSGLGEGIDKYKKMLYAGSLEHGARRADEVIILGDGASWISKFKEEYFPNAVQILDWYHADPFVIMDVQDSTCLMACHCNNKGYSVD